MADTGYRNPNDIDIQAIYFVTVYGEYIDIKGVFEELKISQQLNKSYMRCELVIFDGLALINRLAALEGAQSGFTGHEGLLISYKNGFEEDEFQNKFFILNTLERVRLKENLEGLIFYGTSLEHFATATVKISRAFGTNQSPGTIKTNYPSNGPLAASEAPNENLGTLTKAEGASSSLEDFLFTKAKAKYSSHELAQFMAQCALETDNFRTLSEYASGKAYEGRTDLGNISQGDGPKYKGRGYIQLTGRANYVTFNNKFGGASSVNYVANPELLAQPNHGYLAAFDYWDRRVHRNMMDFSNTARATQLVRGSSTGASAHLDRRQFYYEKYLKILGLSANTVSNTTFSDVSGGTTTQANLRPNGNNGGNTIDKFMKSLYDEYFNSARIQQIYTGLKNETTIEISKTFEADKTKTRHRIVVPNFTLEETFQYFINEADNTNQVSLFVYYEDNEGFKFKDISSLVSVKSKDTYIYLPFNYLDIGSGKNLMDKNKIISYQVMQETDSLFHKTTGMYNSKTIKVDVLGKSVNIEKFNYKKMSDHFSKLNTTHRITGSTEEYDDSTAVVDLTTTRKNHDISGIFSGEAPRPKTRDGLAASRRSYKNHLKNVRMVLEIPGNYELNVGDKISIIIPESTILEQEKDNESKIDKYLSGYYLITKVIQNITATELTTSLDVVKDTESSLKQEDFEIFDGISIGRA
jgi:predicted chitinase